jgi:ubiquitin C-terminal hydrolase
LLGISFKRNIYDMSMSKKNVKLLNETTKLIIHICRFSRVVTGWSFDIPTVTCWKRGLFNKYV